MYNPYGPQGNNQPYNSPPGPTYGPMQGQQYPPGPSNPYYPYPGGPMPLPTPPPKKKKGRAILIVLPILLVLCSLSGWVCANGDFVLGDGIRVTGFLAEPRVQATATYTASHYPFGTEIIFEDDLSTLSGKWNISSGCMNQGSALHVSAAAQAFNPCLSTYSPFFDSHGKYTYEVTIKQMDAPAAGLIFSGKNEGGDEYYHFFLVSSDGSYALSVYDNLGRPNYQVIQSGRLPGQLSFPLHIGMVFIEGQSIGLYANGVELAHTNDDNAGTSGDLGVAVFNNQGTKTASADFVSAKCWAHRSDW